jgi:hypothetical protein
MGSAICVDGNLCYSSWFCFLISKLSEICSDIAVLNSQVESETPLSSKDSGNTSRDETLPPSGVRGDKPALSICKGPQWTGFHGAAEVSKKAGDCQSGVV